MPNDATTEPPKVRAQVTLARAEISSERGTLGRISPSALGRIDLGAATTTTREESKP
jgi:hypothetical protein